MLPVINFKFGNIVFDAATYPVFIFISMATGFIMSLMRLKKIGLSVRTIIFIYASICTSFLAGARFFNFMLRWDDYKKAGVSVFTLKLSYFSLYGGIIMSVFVLYLILNKLRINKLLFWDKLTIPFLISFIIMKVGCFLNGCCYGKQTTSFFSVPLPVREAEKMASSKIMKVVFSNINIRVYPAQFMEAFFAAAIILFLILYRKKLVEGASFCCTAILFSMARLVVLQYRSTSYSKFVLHIGYPLFYTGIITAGVFFLVINKNHSLKKSDADKKNEVNVEKNKFSKNS